MNLIGKWKVKEILYFTAENGMEWKTTDELAALGADEDLLKMCRDNITVFDSDGTVKSLMPIPEGQIEDVKAEGMEICGDMAVIETKEWKTENGKNMYNTHVEGEIFGEEVSPWIEVKEIGDMIELQSIRLVRTE